MNTSDICQPDIRDIDLNLLNVFLAVYDERSATKAAERLRLTQASVSNKIAELRRIYRDPLFKRTGRGLIPTSFADRIYPFVRDSLSCVQSSLRLQDNDYIGRTISIGLSDDFELAFSSHISKFAKNITGCGRIHFKQTNSHLVSEALLTRSFDIALTAGGYTEEGISSLALGSCNYACLIDPDVLDIDAISLPFYLAHEHVMLSASGLFGIVDDVLASIGLTRKVRTSTTHFAAIPYLVKGTDCISTIPKHAAKAIAKMTSLRCLDAPIEFPSQNFGIAWRNFAGRDRVIKELIDALKKELPAIYAELCN